MHETATVPVLASPSTTQNQRDSPDSMQESAEKLQVCTQLASIKLASDAIFEVGDMQLWFVKAMTRCTERHTAVFRIPFDAVIEWLKVERLLRCNISQ